MFHPADESARFRRRDFFAPQANKRRQLEADSA
jgi:hypothetical protein